MNRLSLEALLEGIFIKFSQLVACRPHCVAYGGGNRERHDEMVPLEDLFKANVLVM